MTGVSHCFCCHTVYVRILILTLYASYFTPVQPRCHSETARHRGRTTSSGSCCVAWRSVPNPAQQKMMSFLPGGPYVGGSCALVFLPKKKQIDACTRGASYIAVSRLDSVLFFTVDDGHSSRMENRWASCVSSE